MAVEERGAEAGPVTRVEFSLSGPSYPFVHISSVVECEVVLEEVVPREGGRYAGFFRVVGGDLDRALAAAAAHDAVDGETLRGYEESGLVEFAVDGDCPAVFLGEQGGYPRDVYAVEGMGYVVVELPSSENAGTVVDRFLDAYPDSEMVTKRTQSHLTPVFRHREYRQLVDEHLTDRQREVLEAAYRRDYYQWPRGLTGEELADELDISSPTLHKHLRAVERKLVSALFAELGHDGRSV